MLPCEHDGIINAIGPNALELNAIHPEAALAFMESVCLLVHLYHHCRGLHRYAADTNGTGSRHL